MAASSDPKSEPARTDEPSSRASRVPRPDGTRASRPASTPPAASSSSAPATPSTLPLPPGMRVGLPPAPRPSFAEGYVPVARASVPDAAPPSRPPPPVPPPSSRPAPATVPSAALTPRPSTPTAFAPPPSSPAIAMLSSRDLVEEQPDPLTFQVYAPDALPPPRPLVQRVSMVAAEETKKASVGARVVVFLVGLCIVVGTASAIVAVSGDDAPPKRAAATNAPVLLTTGSVPIALPPATLAITAPVVTAEPEPEPPRDETSTAAPTASVVKPKPKSSAPAAVRGAAPPPNPYGGTPAPTTRRPAKKGLSAPNPF